MKKNLFIAVLGLIVVLVYVVDQYRSTERKWKTAEANVKAYSNMLDSSRKDNTALQLTVDQLNSSKDSILVKLNDVRKELKIKDKKLQSVQYVETAFHRTDTIVMRDTLFREKEISVDTVIGDRWYTLRLKLKYPSTFIVSPKFQSEKYTVISTKRETVNPPKKFFLFRWFQKKHTVVKVDVVERNPYIDNGNERYVEIIR